MKVIEGNNVVIFIRNGGVFYPALCGIQVTLEATTEEILTTTRTSGIYRTRTGRIIDWRVNFSGLTKIDNSDGEIGFFWMLERIGTVQYIRIRYRDEAGNERNVEGNVLLKDQRITSTVGGFAIPDLTFPGSGKFTVDPLPGGDTNVEERRLYLATAEGSYTVSHNDLGSLAGEESILLVGREEGNFEVVNGSPAGRQVRYEDHTTYGTLIFDPTLPFNAGEIVYVLFLKPV